MIFKLHVISILCNVSERGSISVYYWSYQFVVSYAIVRAGLYLGILLELQIPRVLCNTPDRVLSRCTIGVATPLYPTPDVVLSRCTIGVMSPLYPMQYSDRGSILVYYWSYKSLVSYAILRTGPCPGVILELLSPCIQLYSGHSHTEIRTFPENIACQVLFLGETIQWVWMASTPIVSGLRDKNIPGNICVPSLMCRYVFFSNGTFFSF